MKISKGALLFLILAAALGPPAQASLKHQSPDPGVGHPGGCCSSYTAAVIQCKLMKDYVWRINGCSLPAVMFKTKNEHEVCADPRIRAVKNCIEDVDVAKKRAKVLVEVKLK